MCLCNKTRAENIRNLLPSFIKSEIPKEEKAWKEAIFTNLPKVIENGDPREIDFWFSEVDVFNTVETYSYEKQELEKLFQIFKVF